MSGDPTVTPSNITVDPAIKPRTAIADIKGVGPNRVAQLNKLGVRTAMDLTFLFPRNYEFPAPTKPVTELAAGTPASLIGEVTDAEIQSGYAGKSRFGALVENDTGIVRIMFFNQAYRADQIRAGMRVMISGTPKLNGLRWEFVHPKVITLASDDDIPKPRPLAVYPLVEGLRQLDVRRLAAQVVPSVALEIPEAMPRDLRTVAGELLRVDGYEFDGPLPNIATALQHIHAPPDERSATAARLRFAFQELFVMQLALAVRRRQLTTDLKSPMIDVPPMIDAQIQNVFGFPLTDDQKHAIADIRRDISRPFPMNRILQGDVGSGKTAVAAYAMLAAAHAGYQSAIMAPTEVLARQHYETFSRFAADTDFNVGLLCGSLSGSERRGVLDDLRDGRVHMLVGTQALVYGGIEFDRFGLCVIDEQHKFGVKQRVALRSGGIDPHYLVMSATPIPRSVAMTMFGDTDLSTIREKPAGRGEVSTYLVTDKWRDRWWDFVRKGLRDGRQAFVVTPRIDPVPEAVDNDIDVSETADDPATETRETVASVESVYEELRTGPLKSFKVAMLHGRMSPDEKRYLMTQFADGDLDVLVSTTVIEVGIDVPNATLMTITGAQRFGLSQLHQLRGRVSRGVHAGHVGVMTDGDQDPGENERLQIFESVGDGFALAEEDFRLRGPGDVLGSRQSGLPPLKVANLIEDLRVLATARALAMQIIDDDPRLEDPTYAGLRDQMMRKYADRMDLGDAA